MTECSRCAGTGLMDDRYLGEMTCARCKGLGVLECSPSCSLCGGTAQAIAFILGGEPEDHPCPNAGHSTKEKVAIWHDAVAVGEWRAIEEAERRYARAEYARPAEEDAA